MKIISLACDKIEDKIENAETYVSLALEYKELYPELAKVFFDISLREMVDMNNIHTEVVNLIDKYRKENGEPPANMMAVYDYLHNKYIGHAKDVKLMQSMYKG